MMMIDSDGDGDGDGRGPESWSGEKWSSQTCCSKEPVTKTKTYLLC